MKLAKAATGARRYNMGNSNAPTRGKVNPKGYVQREVKKRNQQQAGRGNDGMSDRRSGLAKTALNNVKRYAPGKQQNPRMGVKPLRNRPTLLKQPKKNGMRVGIPKNTQFGNDDMRVGIPEGEGFGQGSVRPIPNIKINQNGQLDLPFDEAFGLGLVEQQQAMNSELMGLQQDEQAQQMEYANSMRDLGLQFEDVKRGTLNQNASGGTAFSSQYAVGASDNARNYNNAQNDLNAWNTQAMSGFGNQRMGIQNAFNDYVRQATLRQAMDLAPEAGDLGYGVDAPNSDWWGNAPKKYPKKAQHNKATLKKAAQKRVAKKAAPKKKAPVKKTTKLKKR